MNLLTGLVDGSRNDTSTAGAGSLSLEFSILSRLVGDPVYERVARRAVHSLWEKRNNVTGLLGLSAGECEAEGENTTQQRGAENRHALQDESIAFRKRDRCEQR